MHINAHDMPPSKPFCFIIEYPPFSILLHTQYSVFEKHVQRIDVEICDYEDIFDVSREKIQFSSSK